MYFKIRLTMVKLLFLLFMAIGLFSPMSVVADDERASLTVKPNRCIALQQGQACFADLKFQWSKLADGEYCLFDSRKQEPLVCWAGNSRSSYKQQFNSRKNVSYEIRSRLGDRLFAQAMVKISWIYKSNNESASRWRLF